MGIWANLLDFLWPVAAKPAEPEPLPPLDFRAERAKWREWPVEQWAPQAERTLRRITGSRGLKGGGNSTKPRPVVDAAGVRYPSVRAAAKAHGLSASTVWDQVVEGRNGWRYAD